MCARARACVCVCVCVCYFTGTVWWLLLPTIGFVIYNFHARFLFLLLWSQFPFHQLIYVSLSVTFLLTPQKRSSTPRPPTHHLASSSTGGRYLVAENVRGSYLDGGRSEPDCIDAFYCYNATTWQTTGFLVGVFIVLLFAFILFPVLCLQFVTLSFPTTEWNEVTKTWTWVARHP